MFVRKTYNTSDKDWLSLRGEFIPELNPQEQQEFIESFASDSYAFVAFISNNEQGEAQGFAEVSVRRDFVNGCKHRPTLYLEGIYVKPRFRGQGLARILCTAAEQWGMEQGCREFASDVYLDDSDSLAAHAGLGFVETERVVYFHKRLKPESV